MVRQSLVCLVLMGCGVGVTPDGAAAGGAAPIAAADGQVEPGHARVESPGPAPFLSRYSPTRGVVGTRIQLLGSFADDHQQNVVTIGGVQAPVVSDAFVLEVLVPYNAVSGPLCVTVGGQSACGEFFTMLTGPLVHAVSPSTVPAGSQESVQVIGEGFLSFSTALLDGLPLDTTIDAYGGMKAQLPPDLEAGNHLLTVKNGLRCGVESLPVPFTVH